MKKPVTFVGAMLAVGLAASPVLAQTSTAPAPSAPLTPPLASSPAPAISTGSKSIASVDARMVATGWRASKIIGASVVNEKDETVGKIDDLMIDKSGGKQYAVISVGGFLGIGDHLVAAPYDSLRISADNKITLPGATKDELKAMPEFKYAAAEPVRPATPATRPLGSPSLSDAPATRPMDSPAK